MCHKCDINMSPSYIQLEQLMIIILQFVAVKRAKINSRHLQMLMPCPSHSTSHEFELLGGITVPRYLDQLEMFKYHCCQNRKRGLNFLIMTSWLIFSNQDKQNQRKKTETHPAFRRTKPRPGSETHLFSLQGRYWVPEAVKAVFYVVPTLALQCIVVCPFVCLQ